jgi:hypothetical protein
MFNVLAANRGLIARFLLRRRAPGPPALAGKTECSQALSSFENFAVRPDTSKIIFTPTLARYVP